MLEALSYLKCPMCGGPLEVGSCEQKHANKLWNGTVVCQRCKGSRVVREGVLDLEVQATGQEASTINAFGKEWTHYWKHGDATRIQVPYSTRDIPMSESCARRNFGYGGGNNSGLKCAIDEGAAYILLLNNESWHLIGLVAAAEADSRIGTAPPRVFYYDRPAEVYWMAASSTGRGARLRMIREGLPVEGGILRSEWLTGCSLLVRVATMREVGLLNERYF